MVFDICGLWVSFSLSQTLLQVHLLHLSSPVSAGAPSFELILTSAISELRCKVIMFTLGESSQCMVLMVECCNGPPPVPGEKNVIIVYSDSSNCCFGRE